jgi:hypothetical protein
LISWLIGSRYRFADIMREKFGEGATSRGAVSEKLSGSLATIAFEEIDLPTLVVRQGSELLAEILLVLFWRHARGSSSTSCKPNTFGMLILQMRNSLGKSAYDSG